MTKYFQKTTAYYAIKGRALTRVNPVSPVTLNYQQFNTLDLYGCLQIEPFSPNLIHCQFWVEMLKFKQNNLPKMEYYLCKSNLWEWYHHNQMETKDIFLEVLDSFIKNMSNLTLASKILEQDTKNMGHLRIVVIQ